MNDAVKYRVMLYRNFILLLYYIYKYLSFKFNLKILSVKSIDNKYNQGIRQFIRKKNMSEKLKSVRNYHPKAHLSSKKNQLYI